MATSPLNNNQNTNENKKVIKVTGYAKRKFFDGGIEYRDFSDDLVGLQLTDDGGSPLFTMGNFSITTNLSPKLNKTYNQGTYSDYFTLDDLEDGEKNVLNIQRNQINGLNLDISNPLSYILYGSTVEKIRVSLENIKEYFPAAIYVINTIGSISGDNISNYSYDNLSDETTFTVSTNYFSNPYGINYTTDYNIITDDVNNSNPLRNLTVNFKNYVIEHNGISKKIKSFSGSTTKTNTTVKFIVDGNPFPEITGINFSQFNFLNPIYSASIPFFIKPNEIEEEKFFSGLNNLEKNILNREVYPKYTATFNIPKETTQGVIVYSDEKIVFPILSDGYNLNFFDGIYVTYLEDITEIGDNLDKFKSDIIKRKYTADVITSFDTLPRGDGGEDIEIDGAKATKLLRIYGVEFDEVKKYIDGIKFAHVITYDKKNNTPDRLVKDLANMLGFGKFDFLTNPNILNNILPSNGKGLFSGTSTQLSLEQIDIELYRRLILNVAWLWKSKGTRKAIEFLFRFIGAPESLVNFNEHIVLADKPVNITKLKRLLYIYTGSSEIKYLPFDDDGYPRPIENGGNMLVGFDDESNPVYESVWYQKSGGWYRETGGLNPQIDITEGNNSHEGTYDGGSFYLDQFVICPFPNGILSNYITLTGNTVYENQFLNYNDGFINGTTNQDILFVKPISSLNNQIITEGIEIEYSIVSSPSTDNGTTLYMDLCVEALKEYDEWVELLKTNCELYYSPEWYRVQQNYIIAKNNLNRENNSKTGGGNEALELCLNIDCEEANEPIVDPCTRFDTVYDDGLIYFTNPGSTTPVSFDEFAQCCVASGGKYYTFIDQNGKDSFFCAERAPCIGDPESINNEGFVVWEIEGQNVIPDNVIEIRPTRPPLPQYESACVEKANDTNFNSDIERIRFLESCTKEYRAANNITEPISGCYQLTTDGERYFGFVVNPNDIQFTTVISASEKRIVVFDKNNAPVGYIPGVNGQTLSYDGIAAINFVKNNGGVVYPNYEQAYIGDADSTQDPQLVLDTYLDKVRNDISLPQDFYQFFQEVDCGNQTLISSIECCVFYGYDYVYVNVPTGEGDAVQTVVQCRDNQDSGSSQIYNPSDAIEVEIETINNEQAAISKEINLNNSLTIIERSKLKLENSSLEEQKIALNKQKRKLDLKNSKTIKPALEIGNSQYVSGGNPNTPIQKGSTIVGNSNRKGVYNVGSLNPNRPNENNINYIDSFPQERPGDGGSVSLTDPNNWEVAVIDSNGIVSFSPIGSDDQILDVNSLVGDGGQTQLYVELCSKFGYTLQQFYRDETGQVTVFDNDNPLFGQKLPDSYGNNAGLFTACYDTNNIPCGETEDVKLVFASNGNNGFYLPNNTESNEVCIKFDYMVKYDAASLLDCANIDICDIPLDLYTNTLYNIDCKNFIVFTKNEEIKNRLKDNINYVDSDIFGQNEITKERRPNFNSLDVSEIDGIPNVVPYWSSENIQVWQTPGLQQSFNDDGDCCKVLGGEYIPVNSWGNINEEKVNEIKNDYKIAKSQIIKGTNLEGWVTPEIELLINQQNNNEVILNELLKSDCITYSKFDGENYCDDFERLITTSKVCALFLPRELGIYSNQLKEYWFMINQLLLMEKELDICVEEYNNISNIINDIDSQIIVVQTEISNSKESFGLGIERKDSEKNKKQIEFNDLSKINNELINTNNAINVVRSGNIPSIDCNLYGEQIKLINQFNVDEFCKSQNTNFNDCVLNKNKELETDKKTYNELLQKCNDSNLILQELQSANKAGDTQRVEVLKPQYESLLKEIDTLQSNIQNDLFDVSLVEQNNLYNNVEIIANLLGVTVDSILNGNTINLTIPQEIELKRILNLNTSKINKNDITLKEINDDIQKLLKEIGESEEQYNKETEKLREELNNLLRYKEKLKEQLSSFNNCCSIELEKVKNFLSILENERFNLFLETESLYQQWYQERYNKYTESISSKVATSFEYIDELKINFNIEVDNNTIGTIPSNQAMSNLDTLSVVGDINPIWTFSPENNIGVMIGGNEYQSNLIKDSIITALIQNNNINASELFNPTWQNFEFTLTEDILSSLYPYRDKQFFISLELEKYECSVCLLIDNIQINYKSYNIYPFLNSENCGLPELNCVIDNRKSWVYVDDTIKPLESLPDGNCKENEINCATPLQITSKNRLWQDLEYRYTEYNFNHSDLIINSKSAAFQIDPAKSIECDVYNFWRNIECDECPTSCSSGDTVYYSGSVRDNSSGTLSGYTLDLPTSATSVSNTYNLLGSLTMGGPAAISFSTGVNKIGIEQNSGATTPHNSSTYADVINAQPTYIIDATGAYVEVTATFTPQTSGGGPNWGHDYTEITWSTGTNPPATLLAYTPLDYYGLTTSPTFSCDTLTDILIEQVSELKSEYYNLTADYPSSLSATYYDLLNKGKTLSEFNIETNNCNSNTFVIGNYKDTNELFSLIVEDEGGTLSVFQNYIYDTTTPYIGGSQTEILSGYTAQTFNQTTGMTEECCVSLNNYLNSEGKNGLGLGKNYVWNNSVSACTWTELNGGEGDCTHCGTEIIGSNEDCKNPCPSGYTYNMDSGLCERVVDCDEYLTILSNQYDELNDERKNILKEIDDLDDQQKARTSEYDDLKSRLEFLLNELQEVMDLNPTANTVGDLSGTTYYPLTTYFDSLISDINDVLSNLEDEGIFWTDGWNNIVTDLGNDASVLTDLEDDISTYMEYIQSEFKQITEEYQNQKETLTEQLESIEKQLDELKEFSATIDEECSFDPSLLFTLTSSTITVTGTTKEICVNPIDFLDEPPSKIKVKQVFDEMVQSNLINAQNRQTLSGYPTLKLFYELYLRANNCGEDLTGKLTYNNLFQFMDLIGDYWLELLEQVIPSTTIMEGCENSGKVYRNTIFDNNKFIYKKYSLNFLSDCPVSGVTENAIGEEMVDVSVENICIGGGCLPVDCDDAVQTLEKEIENIKEEISQIDVEISNIDLAMNTIISQIQNNDNQNA